jgi:hypothetical protein
MTQRPGLAGRVRVGVREGAVDEAEEWREAVYADAMVGAQTSGWDASLPADPVRYPLPLCSNEGTVRITGERR